MGSNNRVFGQDFDQLEESVAVIINKYNVPGASYAIVLNDSTTYSSGVGKVSNEIDKPVNADTRFRVGSIAKSFIALGLLKLQEEKKLNLDANLVDVIPEIKIDNPWAKEAPITIRHLLEHTAGLNDMEFSEIFTDEPELSVIKAIALTPSALKVEHKPGLYFSYSNPGYLLAGYILEKYTEEDYDIFLKKELLDSLNMFNSTFKEKSLPKGEQPIGHVFQGNRPVASKNKQQINKWAGSLVTTSSDMAHFLSYLIKKDSSSILNGTSLIEMETSKTSLAARHNIVTGYGLGNMKNTYDGHLVQGNRGGGYNLHARYFYINSIKRGYFFALNASHGACGREIDRLLFKFITNNTKKSFLEEVNPSKIEVEPLLGFYKLKTNRISLFKGVDDLISGMELSFEDNRFLAKEVGGKSKELYLGNENKYFYKGSATSHILIKDIGGETVFVDTNSGGQYYVKGSKAWFWTKRLCVMFGLVISIISLVLFPMKWLIGKLRGKGFNIKKFDFVHLILPLILVCIMFIPTTVNLQDSDKLGSLNFRTLTFFCLTLCYPLLSLYGWFLGKSIYNDSSRAKKALIVFTTLSSCMITLFMITNGYVGVRLW